MLFGFTVCYCVKCHPLYGKRKQTIARDGLLTDAGQAVKWLPACFQQPSKDQQVWRRHSFKRTT